MLVIGESLLFPVKLHVKLRWYAFGLLVAWSFCVDGIWVFCAIADWN